MKRYEFNQYGCCTNPDIIGSDNANNSNCVMVAHSEVSGWVFGYRYATSIDGGGYSPSLQNDGRFSTKKDAVMAAIKSLKSVVEQHEKMNMNAEPIKACIARTFDEINQTKLDFDNV